MSRARNPGEEDQAEGHGQYLIMIRGKVDEGEDWRDARAQRVGAVIDWLKEQQRQGELIRFHPMPRVGQIAVQAPKGVIDGLANREEVDRVTEDEPTDVL